MSAELNGSSRESLEALQNSFEEHERRWLAEKDDLSVQIGTRGKELREIEQLMCTREKAFEERYALMQEELREQMAARDEEAGQRLEAMRAQLFEREGSLRGEHTERESALRAQLVTRETEMQAQMSQSAEMHADLLAQLARKHEEATRQAAVHAVAIKELEARMAEQQEKDGAQIFELRRQLVSGNVNVQATLVDMHDNRVEQFTSSEQQYYREKEAREAELAFENTQIEAKLDAQQEELKEKAVTDEDLWQGQREAWTAANNEDFQGLGTWLKERRENLASTNPTMPTTIPTVTSYPSSPEKALLTDRSSTGELTARRAARPRMKFH